MEYFASNSPTGLTSLLSEDEERVDNAFVISSMDYYPLNLLPLESSYEETDANVFCVPSYVESLVLIANLESSSLTHLNLTQELILGIYNGTVLYWDHVDIRRVNPRANLPHEEINALYRTSESGTTYVLSSFFSSISSQWREKYGASVRIPFETILSPLDIALESNSAMINYVSYAGFSIGYTSLSLFETTYVPASDPVVLIHVLDHRGQFIKPERKSIVAAVTNSKLAKDASLYPVSGTTFLPSQDHFNLFNVDAPQAYPIVTYTYWCMQKHQLVVERGVALYLFLRDSLALMADQVKFSSTYRATLAFIPNLLLIAVRKEIDKKMVCGSSLGSCKRVRSELGNKILLPLLVTLGCVAALALCLLVAGSAYFIIIRLFFVKKKGDTPSKKRREKNELMESLIDRDILEELNVDQRTNIDPSEFTLDKQIGSGSFSEVYKGRWNGAPVAIKRFSYVDVDAQKEILDDFLKETALMSTLHHPNIVKFYGAAKKHPHLYIISEYCERGSLYSIIRDTGVPLSNRKLLGMAIDIARGMTYLHGSEPPIIHRDLKTGNLLCDKNWTIKVADFGLSRVADKSRRMTLCGTAETCAPEVLSKNHTYSEKADVYSFGIVLWEMFSRQPLYPDLNFFELSQKVVEEDLRPDLSELPDKVPKSIVSLMQQCWKKEPEKRPSFSSVRKELEDILAKYQADRSDKRFKSPKSQKIEDPIDF